MKRAGIAVFFVVLGLAGALAASVFAGNDPLSVVTTSTTETTVTSPLEPASTDTATTATVPVPTETETTTTTTATTPIETAPVTTAPKPKPRPRPKPKPKPEPKPVLMPAGVTIAGIHVGGLSPDAALAVVRTAFATPLPLVLGARKFSATPQELGAVAYAKAAVARARHAARGTRVPLNVVVHVARTRAYVDGLAAGFARAPVDSVLVLRNLEPWISKGAAGRKLDAPTAVRRIAQELVANARAALTLPVEALPQKVSRANYGPVIVIRRGSNHLYLYKGMQPWRTFQVATGQAIYPTPLGRFSIAVMWKNPWWYPPASPWAQGLKPVPPGPGNPLGTRWMGLTSPGVGIHGTPDSGSIGYSVSHGCIRMLIPDAEWLFDHVVIGTPVFIVAS